MPAAGSHSIFDPMCGCDGVTYWNSGYLEGSSRVGHHANTCKSADTPTAKACAPINGCGNGEHCAYVKASCSSEGDLTGACWVVADKCELTAVNEVACDDFQDGMCTNLCSLILNETPFIVVDPNCTIP